MAEPPTTTAAPSLPSFGDGQQIVGQDIQPGVYRTEGAGGFNCYFQRLKGLSGEFGDIITNGNSTGPVIVEIAATDVAFDSNGCKDWIAFLGAPVIDSFGDGDWAVGSQLSAGRWSTDGDPSSVNCYWERDRGFTHTFGDIVANNNTNGKTTVEIRSKDVRFTSDGCGTWRKVG
ncbi:MAG: hypothetical protein ABIQ39_07505 [Ilumatobacteraceae bacterium]